MNELTNAENKEKKRVIASTLALMPGFGLLYLKKYGEFIVCFGMCIIGACLLCGYEVLLFSNLSSVISGLILLFYSFVLSIIETKYQCDKIGLPHVSGAYTDPFNDFEFNITHFKRAHIIAGLIAAVLGLFICLVEVCGREGISIVSIIFLVMWICLGIFVCFFAIKYRDVTKSELLKSQTILSTEMKEWNEKTPKKLKIVVLVISVILIILIGLISGYLHVATTNFLFPGE